MLKIIARIAIILGVAGFLSGALYLAVTNRNTSSIGQFNGRVQFDTSPLQSGQIAPLVNGISGNNFGDHGFNRDSASPLQALPGIGRNLIVIGAVTLVVYLIQNVAGRIASSRTRNSA